MDFSIYDDSETHTDAPILCMGNEGLLELDEDEQNVLEFGVFMEGQFSPGATVGVVLDKERDIEFARDLFDNIKGLGYLQRHGENDCSVFRVYKAPGPPPDCEKWARVIAKPPAEFPVYKLYA